MQQSFTLTLGIYWEKRLSAEQMRFIRACESLARVRRLKNAQLARHVQQIGCEVLQDHNTFANDGSHLLSEEQGAYR